MGLVKTSSLSRTSLHPAGQLSESRDWAGLIQLFNSRTERVKKSWLPLRCEAMLQVLETLGCLESLPLDPRGTLLVALPFCGSMCFVSSTVAMIDSFRICVCMLSESVTELQANFCKLDSIEISIATLFPFAYQGIRSYYLDDYIAEIIRNCI